MFVRSNDFLSRQCAPLYSPTRNAKREVAETAQCRDSRCRSRDNLGGSVYNHSSSLISAFVSEEWDGTKGDKRDKRKTSTEWEIDRETER